MSEKFKFTLVIGLISLLGFMGSTIYIAALPELSFEFHVSFKLINFTLTIFFIGFIFGTALSGPLSEIYGRVRVLTFFLILFSGASLICGFSSSIVWFLVGRFLEGIGSAGGPIIAMALIADRYNGTDYYKLLSFSLIMMGMGGGIAPIVGSFIIHFFEWPIIFYFLTFLGTLASISMFFTRVETQLRQQEVLMIIPEYRFFINHPFFRYYCLMIGVLYGAFYTFVVISPYIFRLHYGWSILDFAWVGLALAFSESLGAFLDEEFIEKIGSKNIVSTGLIVVAIALFMLSVMGLPERGLWILLTGLLFVTAGNFTSACLVADAVKMGPQYTGVASSLINLSKIICASLALLLLFVLPETLATVIYVILGALTICVLGYLKIHKAF